MTPKRNKGKISTVFVACLFFVLFVAYEFDYIQLPTSLNFDDQEIIDPPKIIVEEYGITDSTETSEPPVLTGTIYAGLQREAYRDVELATTYKIELPDGDFTRYLDYKYAVQYTNTGFDTAFVVTMDEEDEQRLSIYNEVTDTIQFLPGDDVIAERHLSWSDKANQLLYTSVNPSSPTEPIRPVTDRMIHLYDLETNTSKYLIDGARPKWLDNPEIFIYMAGDGVRAYHIPTGQTKLIAGITTQPSPSNPNPALHTTIGLAVTDDGQTMVITYPRTQLLAYYRVRNNDDWDTLSAELVAQMDTAPAEFYWPLFSPDSQFLAVQAIDRDDNENRTNDRIEIRRIFERAPIWKRSLGEYTFTQNFLDDWE